MKPVFTRQGDSDRLRRDADDYARQSGTGATSDVFGNTQTHHILPVEIFNDMRLDEDILQARLDFINTYFPDFNINDGRYLQVLPSDTEAIEQGVKKSYYATLHANGSGLHLDYNRYVAENLDALIARANMDPNFDVEKGFDRLIKTLRTGLVSTDPADILFNLSHRDPVVAERFRTLFGDERADEILSKEGGELSDRDKADLRTANGQLIKYLPKNLYEYEHVDRFIDKSADGVIKIGEFTYFSVGPASVGFVLLTASANAVDAHGSAALDVGALGLVGYGLYHDGILEDASLRGVLNLIKNSNIVDLIAGSVDDILANATLDVVISGAATAFGVGLLWNGVQILQSAEGFDDALTYAASKAPNGSLVKKLGNLVASVKELGAARDIRKIANLIEDTDEEFAAAVVAELNSLLNGLIGDDKDEPFQATSLIGAIILLDNVDLGDFDPRAEGIDTIEGKIKFALGESLFKDKKFAEYARLFPNECFAAGASINMWPLDARIRPNSEGQYDQDLVRSAIWQKSIEQIEVGDAVVAFDTDGNMVPGHVPRIFQQDSKIILNFFGTHVTPGHGPVAV